MDCLSPSHLDEPGMVATSPHAHTLGEKNHCSADFGSNGVRLEQKTRRVPSGCHDEGDHSPDHRGGSWRGSRQD